MFTRTSTRTSHEAIDQAVANAVAYARANEAMVAPLEVRNVDLYESLAAVSDGMVLRGLYQKKYVVRGNEVVVDTVKDLAYAMGALGMQLGFEIPPQQITSSVQHESEHASALKHLGIKTVRYGLVIAGVTPGSPWFEPFSIGEKPKRGMTKLGFAAMTSMPTQLSPCDISGISKMGYDGVPDIAARIEAVNSAAGRTVIPIPLSYSLA